MIYILGGAARSGKTITAKRLCKEKSIPYFNTDLLSHGLEKGAPEVGVKITQHLLDRDKLLTPIVRSIIEKQIVYGDDYLFEGDGILPSLANEFKDAAKVCFTGYTDITVDKKFELIRKFEQIKDDWTKDIPDNTLKEYLQEMIVFSKYIKDECQKYNIKYFDNSENFDSNLGNVYNYLIN